MAPVPVVVVMMVPMVPPVRVIPVMVMMAAIVPVAIVRLLHTCGFARRCDLEIACHAADRRSLCGRHEKP